MDKINKFAKLKSVWVEVLALIAWLLILVSTFEYVISITSPLGYVAVISAFLLGALLVDILIREVSHKGELSLHKARVDEFDKQKEEFMSMAAHEMRSPLTAVKGYTSMILAGDAGEITSKARSYLGDLDSVTDRLIRLVNNMLNATRLEAGRIVYQMENTNLIKAAQEVYNTFRFEAERKGLECKIEIPDGVKDLIWADPDKIREVMGNLVSNAVKYTQHGQIDIMITNPSENTVRFAVSDTGPGISKEEQARIFKKFYRAESTAGKTIGTGLGLYISKLLIENFKGSLGLESESEKGSTFWFDLPISTQKK